MQGVDAYQAAAGDKTMEQFVLEYRPLVKKIALYMKKRLPSHIDADDLIQAGLIGLLEAKKNYKPNMGASFETFASIRIRGAIIDTLRKNSWISRDTLKNMRRVADAISRVEQREQKQAVMEDIIDELGVSADEYFKISQEISISHVVSLDELDWEGNAFGNQEANPQEITQQESIEKRVKTFLEDLPKREQLVLSLYYMEELTFKQIGDVLDLTEARICQLHSQAIARIQAKLKAEHVVEKI